MLRTPKSLNGFRRLAEAHYGLGDFRVESSDGQITVTRQGNDWRRSIRIAVICAVCSSVIIFSMNWPTPSSFYENVISVLVGLFITACPILSPLIRERGVPDWWLRASLAERRITVLDFRALNKWETMRRTFAIHGLDRPPRQTISFSFDEILGICDVLEEFWDSYCELQIFVEKDGVKECFLVAESAFGTHGKQRCSVFEPLAQRLSDEMGVAHYSMNLTREILTVDGKQIMQVESYRLPI